MELKIFEKTQFGSVRVIMKDGEPWFVASDVAKALGYENPSRDVQRHCKKVNKITQTTDSVVPPLTVLTLTTKVTGKGQIYFVNRFVGGIGPEATA